MSYWLRPVAFRLFEMVGSLIVLILIMFLLLKILPGGPFDEEAPFHPLVRQNLNEIWKRELPLYDQIIGYIKNVGSFDFGESLTQPGRKVSEIISHSFKQTALVNLIALGFAIGLGFFLSYVQVVSRNDFLRGLVQSFINIGISLPTLFFAPILIYIFAIQLEWVPLIELKGPQSFLLPILVLSLRPASYLSRMVTRSWEQNLKQDYIRTAFAKGLSYSQVMIKHALRNSMIPIVSYLTSIAFQVLSGSFLVESLFMIPGLGSQFVQSIDERDYPVLMGITLGYATFMMLLSWIVDIVNPLLDPRLRGEN